MTWSPLAALIGAALSLAGQVAATAGEAAPGPVLEGPTLHSVGIHWVVPGPESANTKIDVSFRSAGGGWQTGAPLFRVEKGAHQPAKGEGSVKVPEGATLYAGSLLLLQPGTEYEVKLSLRHGEEKPAREAMLKIRTRVEPVAPADAKLFHVIPGEGGGTGSEADPFRGLQTAQSNSKPGCIFLLHAGVYPPVQIRRSGEPGRPIIWRGAGDGETIVDGGEQREGRLISADNLHDVWFEDLTLRRGGKAIAGLDSGNLVVRRCKMSEVEYGIFVTRNTAGAVKDWFVSDNVIEGPSTWPREKGIESARGIQLTGEGHVVCYNRIRGFADAIDTFPSAHCANMDFHNNDISEMTDDGVELDFSERNVRCFHNRLTNVFQGLSTQPIYGGPVYLFRNALYNVVAEPFKLHNSPSGVLIFHNTVVKDGMPLLLQTGETVRNCWTRNNLFVGTSANYAFECSAKMHGCDFDYDGFAGGPWNLFLKWNGARYATVEEARAKAPVYRNAIALESTALFAGEVRNPADKRKVYSPSDVRLRGGSKAIDAGQKLPGFNDGFAGAAPDLGAYELDQPLPHYGPRPKTGQASLRK
jgi:hypothetical protein